MNPPATDARAGAAASLRITRNYPENLKIFRGGGDPQSTMPLAEEVWQRSFAGTQMMLCALT